MTNGFFEEKSRYDALIQLVKKDFPELANAKVIITDDGDNVIIAAKAAFINVHKEENRIFANSEVVGHHCTVSKTEPITKFFDVLKEVLETVSAMVEDGKNGRLNKDVEA